MICWFPQIFSILPQIIPVQGVEYDLVAQPEMYGQPYLQLSRDFKMKALSYIIFNGFIRTDGISISVLIEKEIIKDQKRKRKPAAAPNASGYFQDHIQELKENKVFIDPNRRDLLYCLGSNDRKLRYTSM